MKPKGEEYWCSQLGEEGLVCPLCRLRTNTFGSSVVSYMSTLAFHWLPPVLFEPTTIESKDMFSAVSLNQVQKFMLLSVLWSGIVPWYWV